MQISFLQMLNSDTELFFFISEEVIELSSDEVEPQKVKEQSPDAAEAEQQEG